MQERVAMVRLIADDGVDLDEWAKYGLKMDDKVVMGDEVCVEFIELEPEE